MDTMVHLIESRNQQAKVSEFVREILIVLNKSIPNDIEIINRTAIKNNISIPRGLRLLQIILWNNEAILEREIKTNTERAFV